MNSGELKKLPAALIHGEMVERNTRNIILKTRYAQIARDFANCPRPGEIKDWELHFYYDLLIPELIDIQKTAIKNKVKGK